MEVTKENFSQALSEVASLIPHCVLASFDTEFTGLKASEVREEWEDTPEERYSKLREGCSKFALIQFGLCFFIRDDSTSTLKYQAFPFNFYLFPSYSTARKLPRQLDRRFLCQPSSLLMLGRAGLDFNKWINEGVPYLNEADEMWWRDRRREEAAPSQEELNQYLGFSQLFKLIVESKVPLVGHGVLLDVLHSYTHFIGDLPEALADFKTHLTRRLSRVYDTLLICEEDMIRPLLGMSISLSSVYSSVSKLPFPHVTTELPASCSHYGLGKSLHEAAYDAYITGHAFIIMATFLGGEGATDLLAAVKKYENRVSLFNCEGCDFLNLTGPEAIVSRDHVFYLTFPKEVVTDDIRNLFSPFGGCRVSWISNTSARVSLHHRMKAKEAYKALASNGSMDGKVFTIRLYSSPTTQCFPSSSRSEQLDALHCPTTEVLGKRKTSPEQSDVEPPTNKKAIFEETSQW